MSPLFIIVLVLGLACGIPALIAAILIPIYLRTRRFASLHEKQSAMRQTYDSILLQHVGDFRMDGEPQEVEAGLYQASYQGIQGPLTFFTVQTDSTRGAVRVLMRMRRGRGLGLSSVAIQSFLIGNHSFLIQKDKDLWQIAWTNAEWVFVVRGAGGRDYLLEFVHAFPY